MQSNEHSIFNLFNKNLSQKLVQTVERLFPGTSNCQLMLSESFKPLIFNPDVYQSFKNSRIRLEFLEQVDPIIYKPDTTNIALLCSHHVNFMKENLSLLDKICTVDPKRSFKIYILIHPRRSLLSKNYLENQPYTDLFAKVKGIIDLNLDFIPIDEDLMTLAFPFADAFYPFIEAHNYRAKSNLLKESDFYEHLISAEALAKLQAIFGNFETVATKGSSAYGIFQLLCYNNLTKSNCLQSTGNIFSNLFIFDRTADLLTPMITQWTYQGLVDESIGINFGTVLIGKKVSKSIIEKPISAEDSHTSQSEVQSQMVYLIDKKDSLFQKIKNQHMTTATRTLNETIKSLSELRNQQQGFLGADNANRALELVSMKKYLDTHVFLKSKIEGFLKPCLKMETVQFEQEILYGVPGDYFNRLIEFIEIRIPVEEMIRLIMLANFCLKGFTEDQVLNLFKNAIDSYGPDILRVLLLMEKNGFLLNIEDPEANFHLVKMNNFELYKKKFKIINEEPNFLNEADLSMAYGGYIPIMIRILENLINPDNKGPKVKFKFSEGASKRDFLEKKSLIAFFFGGLTLSEVSAIRQLGKIYGKNIMIITTEIITSKTIANSFLRKL